MVSTVAALLGSPLSESLPRFSAAAQAVVPHIGLLLLSGDCVEAPLRFHGDAMPAGADAESEMARLAATVEVGEPWVGEVTVEGAGYPVLAVAASPPGSAGSLLAASLRPGFTPDPLRAEVFQKLWEVMAEHVFRLNARTEPAKLSQSRIAAGERARVAADLTDAHAATLTAMLGALRSRELDDRSARRAATDLATEALIETRAPRRGTDEGEASVGEAFRQMAQKLTLLLRYHDARLELSAPENNRHPLSNELANGARATVRAAVLTMLEQREVTRIRVAWRVDGDVLDVSVRDDGQGLLAEEDFGVHRIATVLAPFAATISVESVPGWGTTLTARMPLGAVGSPDGPQARLLATLNPRETEVLLELTRGRRNRDIATRLHISEHTVKYHVANVLTKLHVRTRGEAAATAREAGLLPHPSVS